MHPAACRSAPALLAAFVAVAAPGCGGGGSGGRATDVAPPTVSLTSPANAATVSGTLTVVAQVSDDVAVADVSLRVDGASRGAEFLESPAGVFTASLPSTALGNGAHTVRVCALDTSSNEGCSAPITVTVSNAPADTTPPTVAITAPAWGASLSAAFVVTVSATDDRGVASVQLRVDAVAAGAMVEGPAHVYTVVLDTTPLADGSHTLVACATDTSSNSTCSSGVPITVSNAAPPPRWRVSSQPYTGTAGIFDVWGASTRDVWAVGASGNVLHWDGSFWSSCAPGGAGTGRTQEGVWGFGSGDVWTVDGASAWHWNGGGWTNHDLWPDAPTAVWGAASNDLWAVGRLASSGAPGYVRHWTGSGWSRVATPATANLNAVWGSAAGDVWAVGDGNTLLRWDGSSWVAEANGLATTASQTYRWLSVWGAGRNDVWFGGVFVDSGPQATSRGAILRWDGATWTLTSTDTTPILQDLWGFGPTDVWGVGERGAIVHWNGSSWSTVDAGLASPFPFPLHGVWGARADDLWVVGWSGTILRYSP